jgi:hypothetical protein
MMRSGMALAVTVLVTSCVSHPVGPARTYETYQDKATTTAEAALSAVSTTLLAAQAGADGDAWGPYLSIVVSEQEDALTGVQGTFASVQPPDDRSDALRQQLNDILTPAVDHVAQVRLMVRRGRLDDLATTAQPLNDDQRQLQAFLEGHQ